MFAARADAVTVNPYLGGDSVEPFIAASRREGTGIFCLVRTSNPGSADLRAVVDVVTKGQHDLAVTTPDGVWHTLWRVADPDTVGRVAAAFAGVERLYVADGHHRSAAAARLAAARSDLSAEEIQRLRR